MSQSPDHDECMICLSPLLACENDDEFEAGEQQKSCSSSNNNILEEIGAVFPCGHVFHLKCWRQYNERCKGERCPNCNQVATLFSKIFISPPSRAAAINNKSQDLSSEERLELEQFRQREREEEQDRMLLRDMEQRVQEDPHGARMMMTMMLMIQSRDLRKAERELVASREECESTKEILRITQSELEEATKELGDVKPKAESLQDELYRLKRVRREAATMRQQEHKQQIAALQEKVDRYKEKLALRSRQLSRRNKELAAKKKLISAHKMELAAKGQEQQRVCEKTKDELRRTKKELELLRELDSLTMGDSLSSLSLIWE